LAVNSSICFWLILDRPLAVQQLARVVAPDICPQAEVPRVSITATANECFMVRSQ